MMFRLQDYTHADVAAMRPEDLRAEVRAWRNRSALILRELTSLTEAAPTVGEAAAFRALLSTEFETLRCILDGEVGDKCPACNEPMEPGSAALWAVDMGDVHAECLGEALPDAGAIKPGDKVQCDPEGIVDSDEEPVEGSDGILVAHAYQPDVTAERWLEYVTAAQAVLEPAAG